MGNTAMRIVKYLHAQERVAYVLLVALFLVKLGAPAQQIKAAPHGVIASHNAVSLQVLALRDDVLRVRVWRGKDVPEDASWAVLSTTRASTVPVVAEPRGFATRQLRVAVADDLSLTVSDLAGNVLEKDAASASWQGTRFTLTKQLSADDHIFGLGDKAGPLDRSGEAFTLWNTDSFGWQESTDPIYKSIPFFLHVSHGRTVGVFLDNTFRSNFDFGRSDPKAYTFGAMDGPIDYYLMYGPTPRQVVTTWSWLTGPTALPPLWALGFQQSRYTYFPASQLRDIAGRLRKDRIPTDVLWLDIDFQHRNWPFTVNEDAYPDFKGMVKDLAAESFKLVVITDLHIARQPGVGYAPYDSGVAGDRFMKNPDGSTYVGTVWPGDAVFPDFTQADTRQWWGSLFKDFIADGVAGFWNDMNEPAVFNTPGKTMPVEVQSRIDELAFRKRVATQSETHNITGLENARATWDGQLTLRPNERPFVMTRASYAGGQRYGSTWTGDNSSTWNHLGQTVPQILNLGLSGFALAGADVGGFAGSPSPELLTKWVELAAFQPIDRIHSAKGTRMHEVWVDGPEQEDVRRRFIEERYRLMPYLYTTVEETSRDGLPIDRPLFLEYPNDFTGGTEFMLGSRLLIAPPAHLEEIFPYEVHLPPGTWYDYWTGDRTLSGKPAASVDLEQRDKLLDQKPLLVTPALNQLPVYVRGGTILPIAPLTQNTAETPAGPLTLRVYPLTSGFDDPAAECAGNVYSDDGHTLNFRKGEFARVHVTCSQGADGAINVHIANQEGTWKPWWRTYRVELVGFTPKSSQAIVNQRPAQLIQVDGRWGVTLDAANADTSIAFY